MVQNKKSLAACSGMSPYGLVARVAATDTLSESEDVISICMGATSADKEGFRELIKKYPIIAINGCESNCVDKILNQKGVRVVKTINTMEELNKANLKPNDVSRLDEDGEKCVEHLKKVIKKKIKEMEE
ncbi:MAG: hypothetical protein Kow0019_04110 [Methanobacteriaceae archaeon]